MPLDQARRCVVAQLTPTAAIPCGCPRNIRDPIRGLHNIRSQARCPLKPHLQVIIVSESSAEATQLVRIVRYTPARRRSSAARSDTPRYVDAQPISVHTRRRNRSKINRLPLAGLGSGMEPELVRRVVGIRCGGIPAFALLSGGRSAHPSCVQ